MNHFFDQGLKYFNIYWTKRGWKMRKVDIVLMQFGVGQQCKSVGLLKRFLLFAKITKLSRLLLLNRHLT